ncbi:hypothetical protein QYE76_047733 [Lolium multiflorum]|uniref:F-box domain-containing protein n=1 Tax=Lolium multiflorum TaxID=4521 RepID=A0AAD8TPB9_LOLMU|nr:hypothetical protein QYE76_047733 [Lolium multiflorum]
MMVKTSNPPADAAVLAAAASLLTDDLIVEILSRLPVRSVHRFKCVSPWLRDLIANPVHRKKLPQTLAGFIYSTYNRVDPRLHHFHFANVSVGATAPVKVKPSLPFLPPDEYLYVIQLDTCNGLLLCLAYMDTPSMDDNARLESHYIVCNPATKRWVDLPPQPELLPDGRRIIARLAFDPAASSQFHVLQFEENDQEPYVTGVNIYSSQTGTWSHRESRLVEKISLSAGLTSVFCHGMLHLLGKLHPMSLDEDGVLVAVDMEGKVWSTVRVPSGGFSFGIIGLSQGCLHYATTSLAKKTRKKEVTEIATVWCMQDYDSKKWVLKHSVSRDKLPGPSRVDYVVVAIHPDCDTIFLGAFNADTLASYDMQYGKYCHILKLKKRTTGLELLPYVPLFSDSLAGVDGK